MKTLAFAIITSVALWKEDPAVFLTMGIATLFFAFTEKPFSVVFNNNVKVNKKGGDHA